jgi:cytochrome c
VRTRGWGLPVIIVVLSLTLIIPGCPAAVPATYAADVEKLTADRLAEEGYHVFWEECTWCHGIAGEGGEGPAIAGPGSRIESFGDGRGILNFISASMPLLTPRLLSQSEYSNVTVYLLLKSGLISGDAIIMDSSLKGLPLAR